MIITTRSCWRFASCVVALFAATEAKAAEGQFSTLSYNVAGLLEPFSSSHPSENTPLISCKIKGYDLVNVQEDFNYHAALYDTCDDHGYRSPTSGGMGVGSGLNTLSYLSYDDFERERWSACNGVDCLTPKGWTHARVRLAEGVYVSLFNLHAQAQTETADLTARRANILQLLGAIDTVAPGDAIIVMGDTNTRYTRSGDNIGEFIARGFTDVWVDTIRGGAVPAKGDPGLTSCARTTDANCEVVDKILYRNNAFITLHASNYRVDDTNFVGPTGGQLSDHFPVSATWTYTTSERLRLSDTFGGPHGAAFNDVNRVPADAVVTRLSLRAGDRLDRVETTLADGTLFSHGGSGGSEAHLDLAAGEVLTSADLCSGTKSGRTRVFSARFVTSAGRVLSGGKPTGTCTTQTAPEGFQIVGFHGRSGDEIDKLGLVYARRDGR